MGARSRNCARSPRSRRVMLGSLLSTSGAFIEQLRALMDTLGFA